MDEFQYQLLTEIHQGSFSFKPEAPLSSESVESFQVIEKAITDLENQGYLSEVIRSLSHQVYPPLCSGILVGSLTYKGLRVVTGEGAQVREAHLARRKILGLLWQHYKSVGLGGLTTVEELVGQSGLEPHVSKAAIKFLMDEGFAEQRFAREGKTGATMKGVMEYERMAMNPELASASFSLNQTFNGPIGNVQTGNHNQANVTQNNRSEQLTGLLEGLVQHIQMMPKESQHEAIEAIQALKDEAASPKPRKSIVKLLLTQLEPWGQTVINGVSFAANLATVAQIFNIQ